MKSLILASIFALSASAFAQGETTKPAGETAPPPTAAAPKKMSHKEAKAECQKENLKGAKLNECIKTKIK